MPDHNEDAGWTDADIVGEVVADFHTSDEYQASNLRLREMIAMTTFQSWRISVAAKVRSVRRASHGTGPESLAVTYSKPRRVADL